MYKIDLKWWDNIVDIGSKGMSVTAAMHIFCNKGVKIVFKKIGHKPDGCQD